MYNTAIFIDGDNIHLNNIKFNILFNDIITNNNVIIKKVYGDWKLESMNNFWEDHIFDNSLEEIQISRLSGKNSTDSKIIVDVMDMISKYDHIDKIILIGCDKDYIPLIRYAISYNYIFEVFGLIKQTSPSIINACTYYHDIDEYLEKINNNNYTKYEKVKDELEDMMDYETVDQIDIYNDELIPNILNNFIPRNGISISDLKKKIRDNQQKEIFGKKFNKLSKFIENYYSDYFEVKIKNGKVKIYNKQ